MGLFFASPALIPRPAFAELGNALGYSQSRLRRLNLDIPGDPERLQALGDIADRGLHYQALSTSMRPRGVDLFFAYPALIPRPALRNSETHWAILSRACGALNLGSPEDPERVLVSGEIA
jgi:hypothetical protein